MSYIAINEVEVKAYFFFQTGVSNFRDRLAQDEHRGALHKSRWLQIDERSAALNGGATAILSNSRRLRVECRLRSRTTRSSPAALSEEYQQNLS